MGGKNAALVFEDADMERTVKGIARASFFNQGQICLCASRILVQRSIYDAFVDRLVDVLLNNLSHEHQKKVMGFVRSRLRTVGLLLESHNTCRVTSEFGFNRHRLMNTSKKVMGFVQSAIEDGGRVFVVVQPSRNGYGARLGQHMASSRFADTIWWWCVVPTHCDSWFVDTSCKAAAMEEQ